MDFVILLETISERKHPCSGLYIQERAFTLDRNTYLKATHILCIILGTLSKFGLVNHKLTQKAKPLNWGALLVTNWRKKSVIQSIIYLSSSMNVSTSFFINLEVKWIIPLVCSWFVQDESSVLYKCCFCQAGTDVNLCYGYGCKNGTQCGCVSYDTIIFKN
jgi:hypothetical protein